MRALLLGGTAWLGGAVVAAVLGRDDEVTCLARGVSGRVPDGAEVVVADRTRPRPGARRPRRAHRRPRGRLRPQRLLAVALRPPRGRRRRGARPGRRCPRDVGRRRARPRRLARRRRRPRGERQLNATGPAVPFADHLAVAREVAGHTGPVVRADPQWLLDRGVEPWMGERSLPLWPTDPDWLGSTARDSGRAYAEGLRPRPLAETLADTLAWELGRERPAVRRAGLADEDERGLLAELRSAA